MSDHSTPTLLDTQRWLRWAITHPAGPVHLLGPEATAKISLDSPAQPTGRRFLEPLPRQLAMLAETEHGGSVARLSVYADAYFARLLDCLSGDFKTLARVFGPERFRQLVADYLMQFPSTSANVGELGAALPRFLERHPQYTDIPFAADLAHLEWNVLRSLYMPQAPALDVSGFASVPEAAWAAARMHLDPSLRLLALAWPVHVLWEQRETADFNANSSKAPCWLVIVRNADWVQVQAIDAPQWFALEHFQEGASLAGACDAVNEHFETAIQPETVMQWFSHWVREGWLKRITFN